VRGRAGGFMCAASGYGIDGAPGAASCAHGDFNNGVLRDAWGWEGHFVTDGNGVGYLWESYGHGALNCGDGASGPTNACRVGLRGGVDVELGETLNTYALAAIADGNISMSDINLAVSRTLFSLIRLGLLDPPASVPWSALGPADVDTQAHRQLALETARQSIVLLRNNASSGGAPMLPLALRAGMKLAVIGPNGNATEEMLANYHGSCTLVAAHSPLLALRARAAAAGATVAFAPGCANVLCADDSGFADAVAAARAADVVVFVGGNAPWRGGAGAFNSSEGEEYDRANLTLSGVSEDLITAVLATGTPTAVILMRGGPIALSPALRENPQLTTLLELLYPGELGGDALADVLTGVYAPTGRLPTTTYPAEFVATRAIDDYNFSSGDGVTYQYYAGQAQEVFGAGLSYTTWALEWVSAAHLRVDAAAWATGAAQAPAYAVNVTNTGTVASSGITVLGFIEPGVAGGARQKLFDFAGSPMIAPGASQLLTFTVPPALAARVDARGETALHASTQRVRIGLPAQLMLEGALTLEARAPVIIAAALP
jgi:beta-D-xylosidase 4